MSQSESIKLHLQGTRMGGRTFDQRGLACAPYSPRLQDALGTKPEATVTTRATCVSKWPSHA
jgi:hypothetical protein